MVRAASREFLDFQSWLSMLDSLTAGALRAWERSRVRASSRGASQVEPVDLLAALLDEPECRACELLVGQGLVIEAAFEALETKPFEAFSGDQDAETNRLLASSELKVPDVYGLGRGQSPRPQPSDWNRTLIARGLER